MWRIYYGDGATAEGTTEAQFIAAPTLNVQVVAVDDPLPLDDPRNIGRICWHGADFYVWDTIPIGVDGMGLLDFLFRTGRINDRTTLSQVAIRDLTTWGVKTGRTISTAAFTAILERAVSDGGLQPKSATRLGEDVLKSLPRV